MTVAIAIHHRPVDLVFCRFQLFLRVFDHLHSFLPFFFETQLRLLNLFPLDLNPLLNLLFLLFVSTRGQLILVELTVNHLHFSLLSELQTLFSRVNQLLELVVFQQAL